jgi:hypothetical protein
MSSHSATQCYALLSHINVKEFNNNYAGLFEILLTLYFNQKFVHNYVYIGIT